VVSDDRSRQLFSNGRKREVAREGDDAGKLLLHTAETGDRSSGDDHLVAAPAVASREGEAYTSGAAGDEHGVVS